MGFLDNLRSSQKGEKKDEWKVLNDIAQLDTIVNDSAKKPVVIFKHSISCGISSMAKEKLESDWDFTAEDLDFYYLDLINNRPVSNEVATYFGVTHQSPQVILIQNGKATYNTSHHQISIAALHKALV